MRLEQLGQIKLNDPVAKYIPDFAQNGKEDVTIRMLLTHYSGLPADLDLKQPWNGTGGGLQPGQRREAGESAGLDVSLQRRRLHRAGRAGAEGQRHAARSVRADTTSSVRWA